MYQHDSPTRDDNGELCFNIRLLHFSLVAEHLRLQVHCHIMGDSQHVYNLILWWTSVCRPQTTMICLAQRSIWIRALTSCSRWMFFHSFDQRSTRQDNGKRSFCCCCSETHYIAILHGLGCRCSPIKQFVLFIRKHIHR